MKKMACAGRIVRVWVLVFGLPTRLWAQDAGITVIARPVEVQLGPADAYQTAQNGQQVPAGAHVRTGSSGIARIRYADGTDVTVKPNSVVQVVGGEAEGMWVRLGKVLIRARRLLTSGEEQTFRSPIAVAAVRGTEFGMMVEEDGRTRVYVFEGKVGVSNVQIPEQEVLVPAGRMTTVEPLTPPTPPTTFRSDEFDRLGRLDALERGEDPVMESSEQPAVESYLAFRDPDIDAVRNPAYLGESRGTRSTSVVSAHGYKSRDQFLTNGVKEDIERYSGKGVVGQHVTLLQVSRKSRLGFLAGGSLGSQRATDTPYTLLQGAVKRRQVTGDRIGEVQGMAARLLDGAAIGIGAAYRRSRIEVADTPVGAGAQETVTETNNRLAAVNGGLVLGPATPRSLGIAFSHQWLKTTMHSGALDKNYSGYNDVFEGLFRQQFDTWSIAGILRGERTQTTEDVVDGAAPVYHEHRSVWAGRGGGGLGLTPNRSVVLGVDLVGGFSKETAVQFLPDGGVREDENDIRFWSTLHFGAQVYPRPFLLLSLDITHRLAWQDIDFLLLPGTPQQREEERLLFSSGTSAVTGIGFVHNNLLVEYFIASGGEGGQPFSHHLLFVFETF